MFYIVLVCLFFFFKQKTAYEMRISDWSSDVCSSDLEGDNVEEMKSKAEALAQVAMKLGQAIYEKEQAAASPGGADAESAKADEDVVDAEFSEVEIGRAHV